MASSLANRISRYKYLYFLMSFGILYYIVFKYLPMFGIFIAFKDYKPWRGIFASEWIGFYHFTRFFKSVYFVRLLTNTLTINIGKLLIGFPFPIIFALLLNEVRRRRFKSIVQTVSYLPHFLSWVIAGGFFISILSPSSGIVNHAIVALGGEPIHFMQDPAYFKPIVIISSVWKEFGWGSIVYLAAISGLDSEMFEAARLDGASRWQEITRITIPSIVPIIVVLLILNLGKVLNDDFEQILFMLQDNPILYEAGDVIETYVYRVGVQGGDYSFATAVGLFKNFIGLVLVLSVNWIAKKLGQEALW